MASRRSAGTIVAGLLGETVVTFAFSGLAIVTESFAGELIAIAYLSTFAIVGVLASRAAWRAASGPSARATAAAASGFVFSSLLVAMAFVLAGFSSPT